MDAIFPHKFVLSFACYPWII